MPASVPLELAGERIELLGDRAMHWPARSRLMVADLHLGKADAFRRAGIGVPRGGTGHDLDRLTALLAASGARELWVLGDMLHGAVLDSEWRTQWRQWREQHPQLRIAVLAGNHDRALAGAGLDVELLGAQVDDGPFALRHVPEAHAALHVLCGHLHPVIRLPGLQGRWPGFWLRPGLTVLPAFSQFTGGHLPRVEAGARFAVCVEGAVVMVQA